MPCQNHYANPYSPDIYTRCTQSWPQYVANWTRPQYATANDVDGGAGCGCPRAGATVPLNTDSYNRYSGTVDAPNSYMSGCQ